MKMRDTDWNFNIFIFVSCALIFFFVDQSMAAQKGVRTLFMSDESVQTVWIKPGQGTVLNFPLKPSKAILGSSASFKLEYVQNDIVVGALRYGVRTNLFVYLEGRRFSFDLVASEHRHDDIVLVRDTKDKKVPARVK